MDKYTELAMRTWYPVAHPLHSHKTPAMLGLIGEAGEVADLIKKFRYKYGTPIDRTRVLEEVGDYWYYLRVVAYLESVSLDAVLFVANSNRPRLGKDLEVLAMHLCYESAKLAIDYEKGFNQITQCMEVLLAILDVFSCTLEELTAVNYNKLAGGRHGWPEREEDGV